MFERIYLICDSSKMQCLNIKKKEELRLFLVFTKQKLPQIIVLQIIILLFSILKKI